MDFQQQIRIRRGMAHYLIVIEPDNENDPYIASLWSPADDVDPDDPERLDGPDGELCMVISSLHETLPGAMRWCDDADRIAAESLHDEIAAFLAG